jgi:DNA-binding CsgD family transcriptional regulator
LLLKNDLIDQYQLEIELLNSQVSGTVQIEKQDALATLLQSTILTDAEWNDFKLLFDKVHKGYIVRLKSQYPSFTFSEIRLILLSRLDLSDREISRMLGISIDAVRKTRHRLRKKLNDNEQLNFEDLIASI